MVEQMIKVFSTKYNRDLIFTEFTEERKGGFTCEVITRYTLSEYSNTSKTTKILINVEYKSILSSYNPKEVKDYLTSVIIEFLFNLIEYKNETN